ncbi:MAG: periplasmic heavy metal sensor [Alphaproteobacteria bacterium]|nr:periplasmic heavy metal sensor [Alphaproteobacteria bacterium]
MTRLEKRLWAALAVSLAVNLLIIGFIVGRAADHRPPHGPDIGIQRMAERLSPEARETLQSTFHAKRPELRRSFMEMRRARQAAGDVLAAPEYDPQALGEAFARTRQAGAEVRRHLHDVIIEAAGNMTPEERAAVARAGDHLLRRMGGERMGERLGPEHP